MDTGNFQFVKGERDKAGRLLAKGTLKTGLQKGDLRLKQFVMAEPTMADLFAAEQQANVGNILSFNAALMAVQLVSVDDFEGPFTFSMIGRLSPADYNLLRMAQLELDRAGEAE